MAFTQLTLGLTLTIPTNGTRNWGTTLRNTTWTKISQHGHTGSGDGNQITGSGIANGTIDLATKVTGLLPFSNIFSWTDDASTGAVTALTTTLRTLIRFTGAVTSLDGIANPYDGKLIAIYNDSGSAINILNLSGTASSANQIITGTGGTVVLGNGQLALFLYNLSDTKWLVVAGGGGASVEQTNFTTNSVTVSSASTQKFRYTGSSAQSLASITTTAIIENAVIEFLGTSDSNALTIEQDTVTNCVMNGPITLYNGTVIQFRWDSTIGKLYEISRSL